MAFRGAYYVYLLSNPLDQSAFYVGCTHRLKRRRREHVKKYAHAFNGHPPVFTVIDVVYSAGWAKALIAERYWISHYIKEGHGLINRKMLDRRTNVHL